MEKTLAKYLPERAVDPAFKLIKQHKVHLKIVRERKTRHGDYRYSNGQHHITVNANLNKYHFLITLIHEIAHLITREDYGKRAKPHGNQWKRTFKTLMLPLINPTIFPEDLLPHLTYHFQSPKASSDTDPRLSIALKRYDPPSNKNYIFEVPFGSTFQIYNGKIFQKGRKRIKRYECKELATGKIYIFQPQAEVEVLKEPESSNF